MKDGKKEEEEWAQGGAQKRNKRKGERITTCAHTSFATHVTHTGCFHLLSKQNHYGIVILQSQKTLGYLTANVLPNSFGFIDHNRDACKVVGAIQCRPNIRIIVLKLTMSRSVRNKLLSPKLPTMQHRQFRVCYARSG